MSIETFRRLKISFLTVLAAMLFLLPMQKQAVGADPLVVLSIAGYKFTAEDFIKSVSAGKIEVVQAFLNAGMEIETENKEEITALGAAAVSKNRKKARAMVRFLIKRGANAKESFSWKGDPNSPPPFVMAARSGDPVIVRLFLDNGADPNMKWWDGYGGKGTALMEAVFGGHLEAVKLLLKHGAKPNHIVSEEIEPIPDPPKPEIGWFYTALTIARKKGHRKIVKVLQKAGGADPVDGNIPGGIVDSLRFALTPADLKNAKKVDLRIIRNTIMARYGYPFKTADMKKHFARFKWYKRGNRKSAIGKLNAIDKKNIKLIKRLEKKR